jgi:hypothetical protein
MPVSWSIISWTDLWESFGTVGSRSRRETIINFNEEDKTATVWTASGNVYKKLLKRLGRAYLTEDGERHAVFTFPAEFLQFPRAKAKRVLTPEQKAQLAGRLVGSPELLGAPEQKRGIPDGA